ncbi:hypothetical protein CANCADRAFT_21823 [Tortispora caseinolytica NRRL Y-17796]|uniref:PUA domain-containing protein n=1 Tax=Tortispora caseinolytica NRRL Y-17796 TaxID=767744 RepID=A0A1E4TK56_9ASCO|nr:hypothetical protein CANCADRAFT_21823 [Tortispora caseinolytica NRRL Y-17796]
MLGKKLTIVIKLGSSSICDEESHELRLTNMCLIVQTAVELRSKGHKVVFVSSGAVAVGMRRMGLHKKPKTMPARQALASIGQSRLMAYWDNFFRLLDQPIGQVLVSRTDISDRHQYLNASNTLNELLSMGVIPIVNENDTLSVKEIKFGDNDTLSAITAGMVNADYLFLLTDVDCLYTANPRLDPDAKPVMVVEDLSKLKVNVDSPGSSFGTGGMVTKLIAAEIACSAGVTTVITRSSVPGNIHSILNYIERSKIQQEIIPNVIPAFNPLEAQPFVDDDADVPLHTRFVPSRHPIRDRQFWLLHGRKPHGSILVDQGAAQAITRKKRAGLLPVGVVGLEGSFHEDELISIKSVKRSADGTVDPTFAPVEIGRAITNYSSSELQRIMGAHTQEIVEILGYCDNEYVADRLNMAFFV